MRKGTRRKLCSDQDQLSGLHRTGRPGRRHTLGVLQQLHQNGVQSAYVKHQKQAALSADGDRRSVHVTILVLNPATRHLAAITSDISDAWASSWCGRSVRTTEHKNAQNGFCRAERLFARQAQCCVTSLGSSNDTANGFGHSDDPRTCHVHMPKEDEQVNS